MLLLLQILPVKKVRLLLLYEFKLVKSAFQAVDDINVAFGMRTCVARVSRRNFTV